MRRMNRFMVSCLALVVAGTMIPSSASAEDHNFKTTIVYRVVSFQRVGDQLFIEAEGAGVSRELGIITATASVIQAAFPDPCFSYTAVFDLSAAAGTLQLHSEGLVCAPPTQIAGAWTVIGGTGAFAGATGSGTEGGKQSFVGEDPVVDMLEGILSYQGSSNGTRSPSRKFD